MVIGLGPRFVPALSGYYRPFFGMDEAIDLMRLCLSNNPDNIKARTNLASYLIGKKDFAGVIEAAQQGLSYAPDDAYLNVFLGMALFETRQYEPAYTQLRRCLTLNLPPDMRSDVSRAAALIERAMSRQKQDQP